MKYASEVGVIKAIPDYGSVIGRRNVQNTINILGFSTFKDLDFLPKKLVNFKQFFLQAIKVA